ncbi:MAG: bifunctional folylpolyglutamate synthase/dihydrofolate synthase [Fusobacteriaceae bacterium]|nr:bifunctional folylpolyglutamate synthase/dihydrofolate synthase [Fusobacteriaceae bacterium]MBN2838343.1 bifunctional folylpolyglutamate synthase/dihydrofolate synthase [Fusobacteriaceae bacterium]
MDLQKTLDELYGLSVFGIKLGLDNINELLKRLGNPQIDYKVIHIAGTNGKGSTASMVESALLEKGFSVGKYTSPHIEKFNERIVLNRIAISDEEIVEYYLKIKEASKDIPITFFEATTAMMFLYLAHKKIDYLVLEVGLGGRYDATNVVIPEVSAIASISKDHLNILGDTLYKIAKEKAGIIKENVTTYAIDIKEDMKKAFSEEKGNVIYVKESLNYDIQLDKINLKTIVKIDENIFEIPLYGKYQGENFLLAYSILKKLGVEDIIIKNGLSKVVWPGRFEIYSRNPLIVLDGAHNEDSSLKLVENLAEISKKDEVCFLTSILEDKEIKKIIENFSKVSNKIIYTSLKSYHRGLDGKTLYEMDNCFLNKSYEDNIKKAFEEAKKSKIVVVAGSLYLLSEFKRVMKK